MRAAMLLAAVGAIALAACARSEDADQPVARPDIDNALIAEANVTTPEAETAPVVAGPADADLAKAVRAAIADDGGASDKARWLTSSIDLDGDGKNEALVYLIDPTFCGTGGCGLYWLRQQDDGWTVAQKIGPAQLPIYRLPTKTDDWVDLGVTIAGGGAKPSVMRLSHGAKAYPTNPTVAPATAVSTDGAEVLIADNYDKAQPLPPG